MIKHILFDLDGTLLPMDFDVYLKDYFVRLATKMAANGYDSDNLMKGIYAGMEAMIKNDGSRTNEEALWHEIIAVFGERVKEDTSLFQCIPTNIYNGIAFFCTCHRSTIRSEKYIHGFCKNLYTFFEKL